MHYSNRPRRAPYGASVRNRPVLTTRRLIVGLVAAVTTALLAYFGVGCAASGASGGASGGANGSGSGGDRVAVVEPERLREWTEDAAAVVVAIRAELDRDDTPESVRDALEEELLIAERALALLTAAASGDRSAVIRVLLAEGFAALREKYAETGADAAADAASGAETDIDPDPQG